MRCTRKSWSVTTNGSTLLLDLNNAVVSNLELRDLLRAMSANVRRVMECDGVGVALPDPQSGELQLYAFDFPENDDVARGPIGGNMAPARAFRNGKPEVVNRIDLRADNSDIPASALAAGVKCVCYLPLGQPRPYSGRFDPGQDRRERLHPG